MSCEICFESYNQRTRRPKILPCGHTFCEECLILLYNQNNQRGIKCPNDNIMHRISPEQLPVVWQLIPDNPFEDLKEICEPVLENCKTVVQNQNSLAQDYLSAKESVNSKLGQLRDSVQNIIGILQNLCTELTGFMEMNDKSTELTVQSLKRNTNDLKHAVDEMERKIVDEDLDGMRFNKELIEELLKHEQAVPELIVVENDVEESVAAATELIKKLDNWRSQEFIIFKEMSDRIGELEYKLNDKAVATNTKKSQQLSKLREEPLRIVKLAYKPWHAAVLTNTDGWSICNSRLVQNRTTAAPSPLIFVVTADSPVLVVDEEGQVKAEFKINGAIIRRISALEMSQRLVLTDLNNKCVYITSLDGEIQHQTEQGQLKDPRGHCSLHQETQLAVCDSSSNEVVILSLPQLQTIKTISHPLLHSPFYPSASDQFLYILNNNPSSVFKCRLDDFSQITKLNITDQLDYPEKLLHHKDYLYITSWSTVTQHAADSGSLISQIGSEGSGPAQFYYPSGFCIYNGNKMLLCDCYNSRLKIHILE